MQENYVERTPRSFFDTDLSRAFKELPGDMMKSYRQNASHLNKYVPLAIAVLMYADMHLSKHPFPRRYAWPITLMGLVAGWGKETSDAKILRDRRRLAAVCGAATLTLCAATDELYDPGPHMSAMLGADINNICWKPNSRILLPHGSKITAIFGKDAIQTKALGYVGNPTAISQSHWAKVTLSYPYKSFFGGLPMQANEIYETSHRAGSWDPRGFDLQNDYDTGKVHVNCQLYGPSPG